MDTWAAAELHHIVECASQLPAVHKALCMGPSPLPGCPRYRREGRCKEHLVVGWERHNCVIGVLARCAVTLMVEPHSVDEHLNGSRAGRVMRRNAVDPKQTGLLQSSRA